MHLLHGSPDLPGFSQLIAFAKILAAEVFPIPLGPEKSRAWGIFPEAIIFLSPSRALVESSSPMV